MGVTCSSIIGKLALVHGCFEGDRDEAFQEVDETSVREAAWTGTHPP